MSKLIQAVSGLLVLSVLLILLGLLVFKEWLASYYFTLFPYLVLSFFVINTGFFIYFFQSLKKSDAKFIRSFMLSAGVKTLLYLTVILVYVFSFPQQAVSFSITLLLLYFVFTAYDLYVMLRILKRKKEKKSFPNHMSN